MKFLLSLIICSQVGNACLDPFPWQTTFNTQYDCLRFGYQESIKKLDEMGKDEVRSCKHLFTTISSRSKV